MHLKWYWKQYFSILLLTSPTKLTFLTFVVSTHGNRWQQIATSCSFKKLSDIILIYFELFWCHLRSGAFAFFSAAWRPFEALKEWLPTPWQWPDPMTLLPRCVMGSSWDRMVQLKISQFCRHCMTLPEYVRVESKSDLICHDLWVSWCGAAQQWKSKGVRSTSIWITDHPNPNHPRPEE
jgi:hypothetical protein